jgi:hypothetical protein
MAYNIVVAGGESGAAFLGSQGDIWDAQKDMLMDILGGCVFGLLALLNQRHWRFKRSICAGRTDFLFSNECSTSCEIMAYNMANPSNGVD